MKKIMPVLVLLLLLTGCGKQQIYGEVLSVTNEGPYVQLAVRTPEERDIRILADGHTLVYSFSGIEDGLLSGLLIKPYITAYDLKPTDGAFLAERICVESIQLPNGYKLKDGTILNVRRDYQGTRYETPEGTEILWEQEPIGPDNISVGGLPSLDQLNVQAQEAILSYYRNLGLLYDRNAQLEQAWKQYLASEDKLLFQSHHLSQDICPSAANDTLIWFSTYVTLPAETGRHQQTSSCTVFDRNTGHVTNTAELFSCDEAALGKQILEIVDLQEDALSREMEQAFRFEYLNFQSQALEVCFPAGSLSGQSTSHILGIEYDDLDGFIHPWAIPDSTQ